MATSTVPNAPELAQTVGTNLDPTPVVGNPNVSEPNHGLPTANKERTYGVTGNTNNTPVQIYNTTAIALPVTMDFHNPA